MAHVEMVGGWDPPPTTEKKTLPIPLDQYIQNVRDNCLVDIPNQGIEKEHDRIFVMVCGGPTAKEHIEEIREKSKDDRYQIICSNNTHDWLIYDEGIIPDFHFMIDPKPNKVDDVQRPHKDVTYLIGMSCDHGVFKALEGFHVKRLLSVCGLGDPTDIDVIRALFPNEDLALLAGGTMAGLRAMTLADMLGYQTVEFYGFDSCYFEYKEDGEPIYYSYEKKRKENILEVRTRPTDEFPEGEVFQSSPVFAAQAQQYLKWKHKLEWMKFIIHGHSLTSVIDKQDDEDNKPLVDEAGKPVLITPYHLKMNRELHFKELREEEKAKGDQKDKYGYSGHAYAGTVSVIVGQMIKRCGKITVLDYGAGKCTLQHSMPPIKGMKFYNYDPCLDGLMKRPKPADLVVCTDVLEHIEPQCLDNVLDDLKTLTKQLAFLSVAIVPAQKAYSDGQNTHKIAELPQWWIPKLKKRFYVTEVKVNQDRNFECVCQSKDLKV